MNNALTLMASWQDKIPTTEAFMIQGLLESIDESAMYSLVSLPLKNPIIGFVLGFFFGVFGVDRFYKGDIGIGIIKLLICWATFGVWWFIDLFLVYRGIKKDNAQKIAQVLSFAKKKIRRENEN